MLVPTRVHLRLRGRVGWASTPAPEAKAEGADGQSILPNSYHCESFARLYLESRNIPSPATGWLMVYAYIQPSLHLRAFVWEYTVLHFRFGPADPAPVKPFPAPLT